MKHHSATHQIAASMGVSVRTVQRLIRDAYPDRPRTWLTEGLVNVQAVEAAIEQGRTRCPKQPRRHALNKVKGEK